MSGIFSFSFFFYVVTFMALVVLISNWRRKNASPRDIILEQIAWGALILGLIYYSISIPDTSQYYSPDSNKSGLSIDRIVDKEAAQYVSDHDKRIGYLESELKETKEELDQLTKHYKDIFRILTYLALFFGLSQITKLESSKGGRPDPALNITE